jgi:phosphohistidine phosphatase
MKKIYIIRHAKSDWSFDVDDFDRPLNDRGKRDAPLMAARLLQRNTLIDAFVSSPANRALKTAMIFAEAYERNKNQIILKKELYHAPPEIIFDVIENMDDTYSSIAVFTHNNGITDFVNGLGIVMIDNVPTCGIVGFAANTHNWRKVREADKTLLFFDYPKRQ